MHTKFYLASILVISVVLRLVAAVYLGNTVEMLPGTADQISYHTLALRLLDGHGLTFDRFWWPYTQAGAQTGMWSYLYTLYLAAVYTLFGPNPLIARLIQAVIVGLLHPTLAYLLGQRLFGERIGLWAAVITAIYVYFIYYTATLMTEPFYITGILASLYLLLPLSTAAPREERRLALFLGLTLAGTILLRQLFLLLVPFFLAWFWYIRYQQTRRLAGRGHAPHTSRRLRTSLSYFFASRRAPLLPTVIVVAMIGLLIAPFTLYNYLRFERFVLLNTNAGYAFFWANHPIYGTQFEGILPAELGTYTDLIPEELRHLDEAALEDALMQRGLQFVTDDPVRYGLLSLSRIPVYFMFWPSAESGTLSNISRVASFGLFLPFMLAGLLYSLVQPALRYRTIAEASLLLLFIILYTGIHLLSWALIRYRLPVDAILLLYAAFPVSALWAWLNRRSVLATSH